MRPLVLATLLVASLSSAPQSAMADHEGGIFVDFPELSEFGYFVVINGDEYWAPHSWRCEGDWAPYARGYLYEDPADGLVWISNDPWGFITEHYGYWRHHEQYGYVWRPIYPLQWRPYVASMFHDRRGAIIGWTPFYREVWDHGYYRVGFGWDDCYWAPYWGRVHYGDFYYHHYTRFSGWYVGVTFYDYDVYYRTAPDHCYRRDWEYRDHHERKRHDSGIPPYRFREGRGSKRADQTVRRREDAPASAVEVGRTVSIPPRNVEVARQARENRQTTIAQRFSASRVKSGDLQRPAANRHAWTPPAAEAPRRERALDVAQPRQDARPAEPVSREPSRATVEPRRSTFEARPRAESRQAPEARESQPTRRAPEWRESQNSRPAREVQVTQPSQQGREAQVSQPSRPGREAQVSQPARQVEREARSSQAEESRSRPSSAPAERVKAAFESRGKDRKGRN